MRLLRIAEGDLPKDSTDYLQLKAIEALGRLRTTGAEAVLRKIAEARSAFRWASPTELRLVASQAMEKIDPEWLRSFVPRSGLSMAEFSIEPLDLDPNSSAIRQRRYPRLRLERPCRRRPRIKGKLPHGYSRAYAGRWGGDLRAEFASWQRGELKLVTSQKSVKYRPSYATQTRRRGRLKLWIWNWKSGRSSASCWCNWAIAEANFSEERTRRGTRMISPSRVRCGGQVRLASVAGVRLRRVWLQRSGPQGRQEKHSYRCNRQNTNGNPCCRYDCLVPLCATMSPSK